MNPPRHNLRLLTIVLFTIVACVTIFGTPLQAWAQFNEQINYQGKLLTPGGVSVADGQYNMRFWLLQSDVVATTSAIWSEVRTGGDRVVVEGGLFSVMLGDVSSLSGIDFNQPLYLGVEIGGLSSTTPAWDGEMSPRKILGVVPAAFEAGNAQRLGDIASTSFLRSDEADTLEATSSSPILSVIQNGVGAVARFFSGVTEVFTILSNGNVGVGTSTPTSRFAVSGDTIFDGLFTVSGDAVFNDALTVAATTTIQGELYLQGALRDGDNETGDAGFILQSIGDSTRWVATSSLGFDGVSNFRDLTDTDDTLNPNAVLFVNSAGDTITNSTAFTFDGTNLGFQNNAGLAWDGQRYINVATSSESIYIGKEAGALLGAGAVGNIALGYEAAALASEDTDYSVFLGYQSGFNNISSDVIGIGYWSAFNNSGTGTIAIGREAGLSNSGNRLIAIGDRAGYSNSGDNNTLLGASAGEIVSGSNNILLGYRAADNLTSGTKNIVLGYDIDLPSSTQSDSLNIGNIIFGTSIDGAGTTLSSGNIGIGTSTPGSKLTVAGNTYIGGNIVGTGTLSVSGTSTLATTTSSRLTVTGQTTLGNASTTNLSASGVSTLATTTIGSLTLTNALAITSGGTGATTAAGARTSLGATTVGSNIFTLTNPNATTLIRINADNSVSTVATSSLGLSAYFSTSAELAALLSDETGTGAAVFAANAALTGTTTLANAFLSGNFAVTGTTTLASTTVTRLVVNGQTTLANASTTNLSVSGLSNLATTSVTSLSVQGPAGNANPLTIASSTGSTTLALLANGDLELPGQFISEGINWTARTAAGNNDNWNAVTYGNGLFVAVDQGGDRVMTSPDGINWTARSAAGNDDGWFGITYGNGLFVAVGSSGDRVMTSPDGINWTARSAAGNDDGWQSVTYGNGLFVAVAFSGTDRVMTSPDGINWTARSAAGNDDQWVNLTYGNGLFVAVGLSGDRVMTSPDGINWTARSAAGNDDGWYDIAYGNGLFVAVAFSGTDRVMTSPDGINWTARSAAGNDDGWHGVTYGNGLFVAVGSSGDRVMTSPDGINWTARSAAGDNDEWTAVTYGNALFVAVAFSGDRVMTSGKTTINQLMANNIYQGGLSVFSELRVGTTSSTTNTSLFVQAASGATPFTIASSTGASLFTLNGAGNLGLGTTTPGSRLTVIGDTYISNSLTALGVATLATTTLSSTTVTSLTLGTDSLIDFTGTGLVVTNGALTVSTSTLGLSAAFTTSAQLAALLNDETGTGASVFANNASLTGTTNLANASFSGTLNVSGTSTLATTSLTALVFGADSINDLTGTGLTVTGGALSFNPAILGFGLNFAGSQINVATSTLGLGDGSFTGLTQTQNTLTANRVLFTNSAGDSLTDSPSLSFTEANLVLGIGTSANTGLAWNNIRFLYASTTNNSISFGRDAGLSFASSSINNIAIGFGAGQTVTSPLSDNNILIGRLAGASIVGSENTVLGTGAGQTLLGIGNLALGAGAGQGASGTSNILLGLNSGGTGVGNQNIVIGASAGEVLIGSNNIALGAQAGGEAVGSSNIFFGAGTGFSINGSRNIFIGENTGDTQTSGSRNIIIGDDVDFASTTASNQLSIGNLIFGTGLDGTGTTISSGNIGIGTTTPGSRLTVAGDTYISNNLTALGISTLASTTLSSTTVTRLTLGADSITDFTGNGLAVIGGALSVSTSTLTGLNADTLNNQTGAFYLARANHTGTQATSTITGVFTAVNGGTGIDTVTQNQLLIGGAGNTWTQVATSGLGLSAAFTTSAQLAALLNDETGTGASVFANNASLTGTTNLANASLSGTLTVTGTSTLATTTSSRLTVTGQTTLGNASTTNLSVSGLSYLATTSVEAITLGSDTITDFTGLGLTLNGAGALTFSTGILGFGLDFVGSQIVVATNTLGLGDGSFTGLTQTQDTLTANRVLFTNGAGTSLTDSTAFVFDGTNLGIGTSTPTSRLTVQGIGGQDPFTIASSTGAAMLTFNQQGSLGVGTTTVTSRLTVQAAIGQDPFTIASTSVAGTLFFNQAGQLAIGTTSAIGRLNIANTGASNSLVLLRNDTNNKWGFGIGTNGAYTLGHNNNLNAAINNVDIRFLITTAGNVTIGSSTQGNARLSAYGAGTTTGSLFQLIDAASTTRMRILDNGTTFFANNVGIGTSTPGFGLSVASDVQFTGIASSTGSASLCIKSNGEVVFNISDNCLPSVRELKHDIEDLDFAENDDIEEMMRGLNPVSFVYNFDETQRVRYGFIADEVAAIDPRLASYDGEGKLTGLDTSSFLSLIVSAVQDVYEKIAALSEELVTKKIVTDQLCIKEVCVTASQLEALLENASAPPSSPPSGGGGGSGGGQIEIIEDPGDQGTTTPEVAPEEEEGEIEAPPEEPESEEEPVPESIPEPEPEPEPEPDPIPDPAPVP